MRENEILEGRTRYRIVRKLASGGMGEVCLAKTLGVEGFEKIVAIKTMLEKFSKTGDFVERFISEAKLVANLIHENIVQIYQLEKINGSFCFILEYVDGISLFDLIDFHRISRRSMPVPLAVFIASRIARGLSYAHSRTDSSGRPLNIVHCDVCPHNILINTEGVPKITDFGIAKASSIKDYTSISGKLAFMAPEQATGNAKVDFRADIYALGSVLFYMLSSGQYHRDLTLDDKSLLAQVRAGSVDWSRLPEDLPEELRNILAKMLAADPDARYEATDILARDLEYFIYKDGYGPTIVTLSQYIRELLPGRFGPSGAAPRTGITETHGPGGTDPDRTVVLENPASDPERTVVLNYPR